MLEFRKITIKDKDMMQEYLNIDGTFMSERNFASLFLWADYYKIKVCFTADTMYLCSSFYKDYFLAFPPFTKGDFKKAVLDMLECSKEHHETLKFNTVSQNQREQMENAFGANAFAFIENRNAMDYIYRAEDLMWLSGKKLSAKRNHINKFLSENEDIWTYEAIDPVKNFSEIIEFQKEWCRSRGDSDCENLPETLAIKKALTYFNDMELKGGILRVNEKMVAFTIGCKVTDVLFGVFFEKALSDVNGAYPMINQQFAQHNFEGISFVNREEDLGIEGLRKAKLSYNPYELTMKYIAQPNLDVIFK